MNKYIRIKRVNILTSLFHTSIHVLATSAIFISGEYFNTPMVVSLLVAYIGSVGIALCSTKSSTENYMIATDKAHNYE